MKKILSKIFKAPAVIFSAGVIAAFAFFVFFQPQKPAVGIAEANSIKPAQEEQQKDIATVPEQESAFLASGSYFNPNAEWSTWFMPPSQESFENGRQQRFTTDLNGDGLLDLIISGRYSTTEHNNQSRIHTDRVYLNNGYAWNLVYSCDASYLYNSDNSAYYSGDCATTDPSLDQPTNHGCFSDYKSWPHSWDARNSGGMWNLGYMQFYFDDYNMGGSTADKDFELLADINGDGLPDYIWADDNNNDYALRYGVRRCVYLNNGHGWDLAYRCVVKGGFNAPDKGYYGDCAQQ